MKNRPHKQPPNRCRGITIIEILVVVGVLILFLSFALPSVGTSASRAELRAAEENVSYSLHAARNLARAHEAEVAIHIPAAGNDKMQTITFSAPGNKPKGLSEGLQNFTLPADIMAVSDRDAFTFDRRGLVEHPGQILLVSKFDDSMKTVIEVN